VEAPATTEPFPVRRGDGCHTKASYVVTQHRCGFSWYCTYLRMWMGWSCVRAQSGWGPYTSVSSRHAHNQKLLPSWVAFWLGLPSKKKKEEKKGAIHGDNARKQLFNGDREKGSSNTPFQPVTSFRSGNLWYRELHAEEGNSSLSSSPSPSSFGYSRVDKVQKSTILAPIHPSTHHDESKKKKERKKERESKKKRKRAESRSRGPPN